MMNFGARAFCTAGIPDREPVMKVRQQMRTGHRIVRRVRSHVRLAVILTQVQVETAWVIGRETQVHDLLGAGREIRGVIQMEVVVLKHQLSRPLQQGSLNQRRVQRLRICPSDLRPRVLSRSAASQVFNRCRVPKALKPIDQVVAPVVEVVHPRRVLRHLQLASVDQ